MHLVKIERFAAVLTKLVGKFEYRMRREIEIVQRSIKHFRGIDVVILPYMLKQHRGLAHAAGADDSDQAVVSVYMPVQIPRKARFGSTGKNVKNASECFHNFVGFNEVKIRCIFKYINIYLKCIF